ncbi:hypothetical protein [Streptomyces avidinii]
MDVTPGLQHQIQRHAVVVADHQPRRSSREHFHHPSLAARAAMRETAAPRPARASHSRSVPQASVPLNRQAIKLVAAILAAAAAGAVLITGLLQSSRDNTVVEHPATQETGEPMTAERVAEILRTEKIDPAGPLPADKSGNIIQPKH